MNECQEIFKDSPINITVDGKRHLGASIGTLEFKEEYINEKVRKWTSCIRALADIAKSEPHAAYAAYTHGEQHKYTYFKRTIPNISDNLKPLDDAIDNLLIPALFGNDINENERRIISMPIKHGGLGIRRVSENSSESYHASRKITGPLIKEIVKQSDTLPPTENVVAAKAASLAHSSKLDTERIKTITSAQTPHMQRTLEQLSEPGASSWLGALPLQSQGFNLTKAEFHDALALRYEKELKNLPAQCPCGKPFNTTHALDCHLGGFVNRRHDSIRDVEVNLLRLVVHDVEAEPTLQPVTNKQGYQKSANLDQDARLDVRARGFWREGQNAYFDVRVTNPNNASQQSSTIKSVLRKHELEKKRQYNRRVMEVEHGSFTPLVFTTTGVMSHECSIFHKSLAEKISQKRGDRYEEIMRYLRVKFSFLALKATLVCLRGTRSRPNKSNPTTDFGLALYELRV